MGFPDGLLLFLLNTSLGRKLGPSGNRLSDLLNHAFAGFHAKLRRCLLAILLAVAC